MDVDRQLVFLGELDLAAKGDLLDAERRLVPEQIDPDFAHGMEFPFGQFIFDVLQFGFERFGLDIGWMQAHHQENVVGILLLERIHRLGVTRIDRRNKETLHALIDRALDHGVAVFGKFLAVEMRMGIGNHVQFF